MLPQTRKLRIYYTVIVDFHYELGTIFVLSHLYQ